jgi:UDP-2,3-diacylglucosamine pyrophosphatase LpxH
MDRSFVRVELMLDAVVLSDLHLGSANCQARLLGEFLEGIEEERLATRKLILNGDVFDSFDFRRLTKNHWKVLSLLRKLSDRIDIIWICGNHDGSAEVVSHLLGVTVKDEHVLRSGGERILYLHGHQFDEFLDAHPILTWFGDVIYLLLQHVDRTHYFAKLAKRGSKTFLRCAAKIQNGAVEHAGNKNCSVVCCGHTHHAVVNESGLVRYYNSGCWTELPCTYLAVVDGRVELRHFGPEAPEAGPPPSDSAAVAASLRLVPS